MPLLKLKISDFEFRHMQLSALRKPILGDVAFKECSFDLQNKFVREVEL